VFLTDYGDVLVLLDQVTQFTAGYINYICEQRKLAINQTHLELSIKHVYIISVDSLDRFARHQ